MPKFHRIVCGLPFRLLLSNVETGERGGASFGAGAGADGRKFQLSRWSQGRIEPPNSEGEACFAFSHSRHGVALQPAHC